MECKHLLDMRLSGKKKKLSKRLGSIDIRTILPTTIVVIVVGIVVVVRSHQY